MPGNIEVILSERSVAGSGEASRAMFLRDVLDEFTSAKATFPSEFHSHHEGMSVIEEEVEELRKIVYAKPSTRIPSKTYAECVQIAAMAMQFATELAKGGTR